MKRSGWEVQVLQMNSCGARPLRGLQPSAEIVGIDEVVEVPLELCVTVVVVALNGWALSSRTVACHNKRSRPPILTAYITTASSHAPCNTAVSVAATPNTLTRMSNRLVYTQREHIQAADARQSSGSRAPAPAVSPGAVSFAHRTGWFRGGQNPGMLQNLFPRPGDPCLHSGPTGRATHVFVRPDRGDATCETDGRSRSATSRIQCHGTVRN